jgi:hypothetical protein
MGNYECLLCCIQDHNERKIIIYPFCLQIKHKRSQENHKFAWISKTKQKKCGKLKHMVFLETTVYKMGEKAENQAKSGEKSKCPENQVFCLD